MGYTHHTDPDYVMYNTVRLEPGQISAPGSVMRTVYEDGQLLVDDSLAKIRERSNAG